jgi:hypothetical protein
MNIVEQPSTSRIVTETPQEISSINLKGLTINHEESGYVFTSVANSVAEDETTNRFVFNTRALEADDLDGTPGQNKRNSNLSNFDNSANEGNDD